MRHSLRPCTILIAQNIDDIPSDLREYCTIIYDTSAKGASAFKIRIKEFLKEIQKEPNRPDNPVLDRLGNITEDRIIQLESEKAALKEELTKYLSGKEPLRKKKPDKVDFNVSKRFKRVLNLKGAERQDILGGTFTRGEERYSLPYSQGNFNLYFLLEGKSIVGYWYVSLQDYSTDISDQLADVRVLMESCSKGQDVTIEFILVVPEAIENKDMYTKAFNKMKNKLKPALRKYFKFFLIDPAELEVWEKNFGLKV